MTTAMTTVPKKRKNLVEREQVVLARNPEELSIAQKQMIIWANTRIINAKDQLRDLEANLKRAEENDWQPGDPRLLTEGQSSTGSRLLHHPELSHRRIRRENQAEGTW